jgi:hypothetical protein
MARTPLDFDNADALSIMATFGKKGQLDGR